MQGRVKEPDISSWRNQRQSWEALLVDDFGREDLDILWTSRSKRTSAPWGGEVSYQVLYMVSAAKRPRLREGSSLASRALWNDAIIVFLTPARGVFANVKVTYIQ
jgi:hypothetical protein